MKLYIVKLSARKGLEDYHFTDLKMAQEFMQRCEEQHYKVELSTRIIEDRSN